MKNENELLQECKLQLEYLNEKFGETGTTNALLTKIDAVLRQPDVVGRSEQLKAFAQYVAKGFKDEHKHRVVNRAKKLIESL